MECVICLENIDRESVVALKCGHVYHVDCIISLIKKRNRKCPKCRERITWVVSQFEKHKSLYENERIIYEICL